MKKVFFATAAGQTVDASSGVKSNDSPDQASPRYEIPGPVFQLPTAEFTHSMLIVLVKAEAVARGFTIFWIFPTPNFAGLLTLGRIFGFFPIPQPSFTKTLIYLILLNNSAFPEKANKDDRPTGRFGGVLPPQQGDRSKLFVYEYPRASTLGRRFARTCTPNIYLLREISFCNNL
ncbi:hypothetical protein [Microcoleus sp. POL10_C6]|uniref:hypothetical protein n=1 Tax=Microcoleus sp. POL10_C6 TaxID=2818852 RepID=UPI002FCFBEE0